MKTFSRSFYALVVSFGLLAPCAQLAAQITAFTYQGQLSQNGAPATGTFDFQFALFPDDVNTNNQVDTTISLSSLGVTNGLFTVELVFPVASVDFNGADRWLQIWVRPSSAGTNYTALTPRQHITSTPYAITAGNLEGSISATQLPAGVVTNNGVGLSLAGSFTGNGAGLTNVSISSLSVSGAADFTVTGWGSSGSKQLPVPAGLTNALAVAAGRFHSLVLKSDGTLAAWGTSPFGQTNIPAGLNSVVAVAAGINFNLVLKSDGTVVAWGDNSSGQTNVPPGLNNITAVAAGGNHCLALKSNGTVVAWGNNFSGQTNVPAGLNNVAAVAAGDSHNLALKNDGTVVAWGYNGDGETNVPVGLSNVVAVAAGGYHSLALKNDGTVVAWGNNISGQTNVPAGLNNVAAVAAGDSHNLALKDDGTVVAWGFNGNGQTNVPVALNKVVALASGSSAFHVLVVQRQVISPLAQLVGPNTFNGANIFNGANTYNGDNTFYGKVGINLTPSETLHVKVPTNGSGGVGMAIDSELSGHSPAIYLNHTGPGGHKFRLASYGDNLNPGSFVVRDDTAVADRLSIDASGIISGNGSGLTLSSNVALRTGGNSFAGDQIFIGNVSASNATVSGSLSFGSQTRQMLNLWGANYGLGVQASSLYFRCDNASGNDGFIWYKGGTHNDGYANAGGGVELMHLIQGALYVNGTLASTSDRNAKENFTSVNAQEVLDKVVALPITRWNYKNDTSTPHLGPVAQDFYAAFGVGPDDKHITTVDESGVALVAIQGLNQKLADELKRRDAENAELKARLEKLEQLLEQRLNGGAK